MKKRSKNRVQNAYTLEHIYLDYISNIEEDTPYYIDKALFKNICEDWFKYIADIMMEQAGIIQLPYRLGNMYIAKTKAKDLNKLPVDWKTSKEIGKKVYHLNPHTDGFRYRFKWSKQRCMTRNKGLYRFKASRDNSRHLATIIKERAHDFLENGVKFKNRMYDK